MCQKEPKIPIYFLPGLAANPSIFKNIHLDPDRFEMYFLEWMIPFEEESISEYALRFCTKVKHENAVLVGVSFGGIIAQEMNLVHNFRKIIIISSVKTRQELPLHLQLAGKTRAYKLIPTSFFAQNIDLLSKYAFGKPIVNRLDLYKQYLSITDKRYLDWAIKQVVSWNQDKSDPNLVHIHGDRDIIFPIENIKTCVIVEGGTHIMILNKYRWLNKNLPMLILE
ncbi:MAG: alpha/beta hydrolase [Flavobacteriaceae bacterium]|nr:alpha/beta hydrolase [Flavobacteriaceae bacterium]MDG1042385.1 alpha/beta hydrolase [Flavobacteriaceae bacterium]